MTTLAQALLRTAECLESLRNSVATNGSTSTLVDANMVEPDQFFNGGTIFFLSGALLGKTAVITDWDETTKTFTFPVQTNAVVAGVRYAVAESRYTREALVQAIKSALSEIGPYLERNDTLLTVANQAEYTLPAGVSDIKRVQIGLTATAPIEWDAPDHWWIEWDGELIFGDEHLPSSTGYPIRVWYEAAHADVYLDADVIKNAVHIDRLGWTAAWFAALNRSGLAENSEPNSKEAAGIANQMRLMQTKHPVFTINRDARWAEWA